MHSSRLLVGSLTALTSVVAYSQQADNELAASLYLHSVSIQKRAPICSTRLTDFSKRFDPAFAKWKERNGQTLQDGERLLRASMEAEAKDFDTHVGAVTDTATRLLEVATPKMVTENCNAILEVINAQ